MVIERTNPVPIRRGTQQVSIGKLRYILCNKSSNRIAVSISGTLDYESSFIRRVVRPADREVPGQTGKRNRDQTEPPDGPTRCRPDPPEKADPAQHANRNQRS